MSSLSSEEVAPQEAQTLHHKVSKGLEKYLQDTEQCQALEDNYFDDNSTCQREKSNLETAEQMVQPSKGIQIPLIQLFTADTYVAGNIPESLQADTGHNTPQESTAVHENQKQTVTSEDIEPDIEQFIKDYPPSSEKQAFIDIYNMLSLLDKYLCDNPKHHTHCMSSDSEYVILLRYARCFNIDLTTFPSNSLGCTLYSP